MTPILRTLAVPAALVVTLALASCGTSPSAPAGAGTPSATATPTATGTPAKGPSNIDVVMFAMMMVPHHSQTMAMVDLAVKKATNAKVKALASKIRKAQLPEVERMSGWLIAGGIPIPGAEGGHNMAGMDAKPDGMMSAQQMTGLGAATGSGFDRMWLQLMVKHHQGAVAMARTQLKKGVNPDGKQVARSIVNSQSGQIATMTSILTGLPRS